MLAVTFGLLDLRQTFYMIVEHKLSSIVTRGEQKRRATVLSYTILPALSLKLCFINIQYLFKCGLSSYFIQPVSCINSDDRG